jgi:YggT family protein
MNVLVALIFDLINLYQFILFVRIILSWFPVDPYNPIIKFICKITDPLLRPIREMFNLTFSVIDFSPMILFFLIYVVKSILKSFFYSF